MASALIHMPASAKPGEVIEVRALIAHTMETGFRPGPDGKPLPRDILRKFECRYNGKVVISAELHPAMSANPYIAFFIKASTSGTLEFTWTGDNGFTQTETKQLAVQS
ncbi:sulfur compound chelating protein SoxZ [Duganella sp. CF458]|uniref:thiosulfate oxidation carrier complex protein SoxZ n=1 Tax=Duganella sp. CF458 TaxID=1884368 RepID=UPI0008E17D3E|nr:thiosulfate oxidation carrier complex protein SoxZ [Duganella sp. CF458]SFF63892.1 sulfur compound chelating protein SoxZ [Duganella sp. CF458]